MQYPRLKEFFRVLNIVEKEEEFEMILGIGPSTAHLVEGDRSVLKLLELADGTRSRAEIQNQIIESYPDVTTDDIEAVLNHLKQEGLLEDAGSQSKVLSETELDRYDRHFVYYSVFSDEERFLPQEKLKNAKVVLIGMGGIGSWVSYALAASGVGHIVGVDHDIIENSNLTRQILYSEQELGLKKVLRAKERLHSLNSNVKFTAIDREMTSIDSVKEVIQGADIVVLSADKPEHIQYWVDEACYDLKIPWTNVGYMDTWGVCGPITVPDQTSCLICDMGTKDVKEDYLMTIPEVRNINKRAKAASFGPLNGLMATYAAMEIIKFITGYEEPVSLGRRVIINSGTMQTEIIEYEKREDCIQCGQKHLISN